MAVRPEKITRVVRDQSIVVRTFVQDHSFLLSLLIMAVLITPGYYRVEQLVRQAEANAAQAKTLSQRVAELSARGDARIIAEGLRRCQERNASLYRYGAMLRRLIEALAADSGGDRRTLALRTLVPADQETADCDEDGMITPADYGEDAEE